MQREKPQSPNKEESLVPQIELLLGELVENTSAVWGPLVARWAVNQLGRWSVEWERAISGPNATLEERVAGWLKCEPVRAMANLTVSCVAHDADNTVAALLEASVQNGPVLNWLVAHVGCSFPATIINRVLSLGLRSFVNATSSSHASHQLASVDMILSHLAERYFLEVQSEVQAVLLSSFVEPPTNLSKAVVPFLLQLANANRSKTVLGALTSFLPKIMQQQSIPSLANQLSWWIPKYFPNSDSLIDLLVHLLLDTGSAVTCEIICLLIQGSLSSSSSLHGSFCCQLLHFLLIELDTVAHARRHLTPMKPIVPLLTSLGKERKEKKGAYMTVAELIDWAVESDKELAIRRLAQILIYVIMEQGPESASFIFKNALFSKAHSSNAMQNSLFLLHCIQNAVVKHQSKYNAPTKTLVKVQGDNIHWNLNVEQLNSCLKKWQLLLVGGRLNKSPSCEALTTACMQNISKLSKLINVPSVSSATLEIISQLPLEKPISISQLFSLAHAIIFYFFSSLQNSFKTEEKIRHINFCNRILAQLSHSSLGHSLIVRLLFECSFSEEWSYLFGAKMGSVLKAKKISSFHLLEANQQFDSWVRLPQSHNTIFHAGKISSKASVIKETKRNLNKGEILVNCQLLLNLLALTCRTQGASQGATTIALLLVEYVSPDIMFNGFPWPEENIKFTFERDLAIKKTFATFPIAWHYLEYVARCRPALCYCSVLVRALTAALTAFWNTCTRPLAVQAPDHLLATKKLLEVIIVGEFLPKPFSILPQMVEQLAPYEVVLILQDVWAYLRDNTPSPDRWVLSVNGVHTRSMDAIDPRYTDRCRKLIHVHIAKFGHLLPLMLKS